MEKSLKAAGDPDASRIEEGMEIYGRIFDQNCTYHVTPYEGIPEMLKALKDKGPSDSKSCESNLWRRIV